MDLCPNVFAHLVSDQQPKTRWLQSQPQNGDWFILDFRRQVKVTMTFYTYTAFPAQTHLRANESSTVSPLRSKKREQSRMTGLWQCKASYSAPEVSFLIAWKQSEEQSRCTKGLKRLNGKQSSGVGWRSRTAPVFAQRRKEVSAFLLQT